MHVQQPIHIIGEPGKERTENAPVELWSSAERLQNGAKILGVCWAIAAATVFIPVLHLITVPLFFFGGIAGFVWKYRQKGIFLAGNTNCPQCGEALNLSGALFALPLYRTCSACSQSLFIEAANK